MASLGHNELMITGYFIYIWIANVEHISYFELNNRHYTRYLTQYGVYCEYLEGYACMIIGPHSARAMLVTTRQLCLLNLLFNAWDEPCQLFEDKWWVYVSVDYDITVSDYGLLSCCHQAIIFKNQCCCTVKLNLRTQLDILIAISMSMKYMISR